jgi:hypothetical protein
MTEPNEGFQQVLNHPQSETHYQSNGCVIGAATCGVLPLPYSQVDVLGARPSQENINAPLINIFDEDPLCDLLRQVDPEAAREVCRMARFQRFWSGRRIGRFSRPRDELSVDRQAPICGVCLSFNATVEPSAGTNN